MAPPAAGTAVSGTNINGLNSYLNGVNSAAMPAIDPDFGTLMFRATDTSYHDNISCLGGGSFGSSFNMGSSGSTRAWSAIDSHGWRKLLIQTSGGTKVMVHFDPTNGTVIPTNLCGGYLPGATTNSGSGPSIIYTANNDQENTLVFSSMTGTPVDQETITQDSTGATATVYAVNSAFLQISPTAPNNHPADNTHTWRGPSDTFIPNSSYPTPAIASGTPYANTIYQGIINDSDMSTDYRRWSVSWSLLFNFNYLPSMAGDPHFPSCVTCGLPQNYNANYTGVFEGSDDDSSFCIDYSDNGQANHTGYDDYAPTTCAGAVGAGAAGSGGTHVCTGPVYVACYRSGYGARVFNSMTDMITGDWGPGSGTPAMAVNGQANLIPVSSTTGMPVPDDIFIQDVTGAELQLSCMEDVNGQCVSSGWAGGFTGWTQAFTGLIYLGASGQQADATHVWRDCGVSGTNCGTTGASNYFSPSAVPANAPFYYPDVLHDATSLDNPVVMNFSMVQQPNMKVTNVCNGTGCTPPAGFPALSAQQTVISYNNNATYSPGQVVIIQNISGAHDGYLECVSAVQCPRWTIVAGGDGSVSGGSVVITDTVGIGYSDTESQTGCGNACPLMSPWGQGSYNRNGYVGGNFWQQSGLNINSNLGASGHSARGYNTNYQGKNYEAYNYLNPSTPATANGLPGGALYAPVTNVGYAQTPPPGSNVPNLLPFSVADDQHGTAWSHGTTDLSPVALVSTLVCGQGGPSGVGAFNCAPQYTSIWDSEIFAIENAITRSSPGNPVGLDCNYGSGPAPCVYRLGHTFNSDDNWNFQGQNAIGTMSPDGNWLAFPSDWNRTLGCMDQTSTNCWSSWEATAPAANGSGVNWASDGATPPNVTIAMTNWFCSTGGSQYYWVNSAVQTIACGTRPGTVQLTGFAESWLNNQTLTLGANTSNNWQCDSSDASAGTCNKFVLAGVPGAPANSSGTESGTQKATPTSCGSGVPCQREDIWIAKIASAHQ